MPNKYWSALPLPLCRFFFLFFFCLSFFFGRLDPHPLTKIPGFGPVHDKGYKKCCTFPLRKCKIYNVYRWHIQKLYKRWTPFPKGQINVWTFYVSRYGLQDVWMFEIHFLFPRQLYFPTRVLGLGMNWKSYMLQLCYIDISTTQAILLASPQFSTI